MSHLLWIFLCFTVVPFSCTQDAKRGQSNMNTQDSGTKPELKSLVISTPKDNDSYGIGDKIVCSYKFNDTVRIADSVVFRVNGKRSGYIPKGGKAELIWNTRDQNPGIKNFTLTAYYPDSNFETRNLKINLLSDIVPVTYTYKVVATYPHDVEAFTEGLFYENGILYEGTGETGQSTLRKVKLETGERLKILNLPPDIFGEGIASVGNKIFQLTYKTQLAYEYDKYSFELINKFNYPMKEGWGMTTDGKNLIMSDGTSTVYYLDTTYFTEVKRIDVYDNKGPIDQINELEYIHGEIWANVYTTDTILRIDPQTGKVLGKIIISDILKPEDYHSSIDYLNGIAYDKEHDRVFITGKKWPKLYQIKIVKK